MKIKFIGIVFSKTVPCTRVSKQGGNSSRLSARDQAGYFSVDLLQHSSLRIQCQGVGIVYFGSLTSGYVGVAFLIPSDISKECAVNSKFRTLHTLTPECWGRFSQSG